MFQPILDEPESKERLQQIRQTFESIKSRDGLMAQGETDFLISSLWWLVNKIDGLDTPEQLFLFADDRPVLDVLAGHQLRIKTR